MSFWCNEAIRKGQPHFSYILLSIIFLFTVGISVSFDRLVNTGGVAGLINSLCIGQFDPKMERLDAILGVQIQGFGLADSVPGI